LQHCRDTALGVPGIAVTYGAFADDHDIAAFGSLDSRTKTGNTAANNKTIRKDMPRRSSIYFGKITPVFKLLHRFLNSQSLVS
jgi:hypothetical protein